MILTQLFMRPAAASSGTMFEYIDSYGNTATFPEKVSYKPTATIPAGSLVIMNLTGYNLQHSTLADNRGNNWVKITTTTETSGVMFISRLSYALTPTDTITTAGPYVNQFTIKLANAFAFTVPAGKTANYWGKVVSNVSSTTPNAVLSTSGLTAGTEYLIVRMTYATFPNDAKLANPTFTTTTGFTLVPWFDYAPVWNDQYAADNKRGMYGEYGFATGPSFSSTLSTNIMMGSTNPTTTTNVLVAFSLT